MKSQALIPVLVSRTESKTFANLVAVLSGVALISLLAQIVIPLPWTPVPITGQTMGIAMVGLGWGWRRAFSVVALYLILGSIGLPIFAMGKSGLMFGPTFGYLFGMLLAATVEGYFSDRGWTKNFWQALATTYLGSTIIFCCGLVVLSRFVPANDLLAAGLYPFLIGDFIKNSIAAGTRVQMQKLLA